MKIAEIDRKFCRMDYKNDWKKMIEIGDVLIWDEQRIKSAFNFNNGTVKDFKRYIKDNRIYARFYDIENQCFI